MPIFEYRCYICNSIETKIEKEKNRDGFDCKCGKGVMLPIISKISSPQFKGKGFYKTDYK